MYTAIVLNEKDRARILENISKGPEGWEVVCHHVTISMGKHEDSPMSDIPLSTEFTFWVGSVSQYQDKVQAIKVLDNRIKSDNEVPHITIAVNRKNDGRCRDSNLIENWVKGSTIKVVGRLKEVK